jgi:hypothetical protein
VISARIGRIELADLVREHVEMLLMHKETGREHFQAYVNEVQS